MFYSSQADELRAFLRDKLGFKARDIGGGWLIFDGFESDMGCHPSSETGQGGSPSGTHSISFYCDDIETTISELKAKGVEFKGETADEMYGLVNYLKAPGDFWIELYQPKF